MLNSFPQGGSDPDVLLATLERSTSRLSDRAVAETARRFICGEVANRNPAFAPSVAEFVQEARRVEELVPYMDRPRLPSPKAERSERHHVSPAERIRMGFKMSVLSAGLGLRKVDEVAAANKRGLPALIALAEAWGVPVPPELKQSAAA